MHRESSGEEPTAVDESGRASAMMGRTGFQGVVPVGLRVAIVTCGLLLVSTSIGCQSEAARAYRGARHYAVGSDALDRGEGPRAIAELTRASELVPHASEIQNHLGLAYLASGDRANARVAFARAVELDCDNDAARTNWERMQGEVEAGGPVSADADGGDRNGG